MDTLYTSYDLYYMELIVKYGYEKTKEKLEQLLNEC